MEITSTLSAPSSRTNIISIAMKLVVIGILLKIALNHPEKGTQESQCTEQQADQQNEECRMKGFILPSLISLIQLQVEINAQSIGVAVMHFFNETLPRIVASAFVAYLGICCGYVGLAHLKIISPD